MAVFAKLINISATALLLMTASCSDERFNDTIIDPDALPGDRAETFEVPLRLHTDKPTLQVLVLGPFGVACVGEDKYAAVVSLCQTYVQFSDLVLTVR